MTRSELKQAIRAGRATPDVETALFESCVAEICREDYGPTARVVTLQEAAPPPPVDYHARMRALFESTAQPPRSDLKADAVASPPPQSQAFAPDFAAAVAAAVANFKAHPAPRHSTRPAAGPSYQQTLSEARADLVRRVPDPIERAYIILSGRDR